MNGPDTCFQSSTSLRPNVSQRTVSCFEESSHRAHQIQFASTGLRTYHDERHKGPATDPSSSARNRLKHLLRFKLRLSNYTFQGISYAGPWNKGRVVRHRLALLTRCKAAHCYRGVSVSCTYFQQYEVAYEFGKHFDRQPCSKSKSDIRYIPPSSSSHSGGNAD